MAVEVKDNNIKVKGDWRQKPTISTTWNYKLCDYVMFVDENNTNSAIDNVRKKIISGGTITPDERFFTITGCIFNQTDYYYAQKHFRDLKEKYWENAHWFNPKKNKYEPVCLHSIEVRNGKNAFKLGVNYQNFIKDLDDTVNKTKYTIISISIDLIEFILNTTYELDIYDIAFDFLMERFIYEIKNKKGLIMLEARGKTEDTKLLKHIVQKINDGTSFISSKRYNEQIVAVYFNPKFNTLTNTPILGLEIADISSYPIHKFIKLKKKDLAFQTLEKKIRNYPDYIGRGIKLYPKTTNLNDNNRTISATFREIEID